MGSRNLTKIRIPSGYRNRGKQPVDQLGIGQCPGFLIDAQKTAWRELVKNDPGVLQRSDRIAVEMTARLMAQIREGGEEVTTATQQALLASMFQKLGQTPTGWNSVSIPDPKNQIRSPTIDEKALDIFTGCADVPEYYFADDGDCRRIAQKSGVEARGVSTVDREVV